MSDGQDTEGLIIKGKVRCLISRAGNTAHYDADLAYISGVPHVVFEWDVRPGGAEVPAISVALDPRHLHPLNWSGGVTHLYEHPIADPRPLH